MPLDTHVLGGENAVRATAQSLRSIADAATGGADAFIRARGQSEYVWASGDEFRTKVTAMGKAGDDVAAHCNAMAQALDTFAGQLAAVKAHMAALRDAARAGLLTVVGEVIEDPQLDPSPSQAHITAVKLAASQIAHRDFLAAKAEEHNAHGALEQRLVSEAQALAQIANGPALALKAAPGPVSASVESTHHWAGKTTNIVDTFTWKPDARTTAASTIIGLAADSTGTGYESAMKTAADQIAARGTTLGGAMAGSGMFAKSVGPAGAMLGALPSYASDVSGGMSKPEAAVSEFGGAAAGAGAGTFLGAVAADSAMGAAIGSVIPGGGTAVGLVVGAVAGGAVAVYGSKLIQKLWGGM